MQQDYAIKIRLKKIESNAMEMATTSIAVSSGLPPCHPDNKSAATILRETNLENVSDISRKSATMMVMQVRIWESPKTRVPNKNIPSQVWNLIKDAFVSFLKLYQASGATQSMTKRLYIQTKKCLNKGGHKQTYLHYVRNLQKETSDKIEIGEKNVLEKRREK